MQTRASEDHKAMCKYHCLFSTDQLTLNSHLANKLPQHNLLEEINMFLCARFVV